MGGGVNKLDEREIATVRVECPKDGDLSVKATSVRLLVETSSAEPKSAYVFCCPRCEQTVVRRGNPDSDQSLASVGVSAEEYSSPRALLEHLDGTVADSILEPEIGWKIIREASESMFTERVGMLARDFSSAVELMKRGEFVEALITLERTGQNRRKLFANVCPEQEAELLNWVLDHPDLVSGAKFNNVFRRRVTELERDPAEFLNQLDSLITQAERAAQSGNDDVPGRALWDAIVQFGFARKEPSTDRVAQMAQLADIIESHDPTSTKRVVLELLGNSIELTEGTEIAAAIRAEAAEMAVELGEFDQAHDLASRSFGAFNSRLIDRPELSVAVLQLRYLRGRIGLRRAMGATAAGVASAKDDPLVKAAQADLLAASNGFSLIGNGEKALYAHQLSESLDGLAV